MSQGQKSEWLSRFAALRWYNELIEFIFRYVANASGLLLATGIVHGKMRNLER